MGLGMVSTIHTTLIPFFISILGLSNPAGSIGIFISLTEGCSTRERNKTAFITSFSILCVIIFSIFIGAKFLASMGISNGAFEIAGGIIILIMGLEMMQAKHSSLHSGDDTSIDKKTLNTTIGVTPLAIPLIAGPGVISSCIVYAAKISTIEGKLAMCSVGLVVSLVYLILLPLANIIAKILGKSGIGILVRISGLVLTGMSVQMLYNGILFLINI